MAAFTACHQHSSLESRPWGLRHCLHQAPVPSCQQFQHCSWNFSQVVPRCQKQPLGFNTLKTNKKESKKSKQTNKKNPRLTAKAGKNPFSCSGQGKQSRMRLFLCRILSSRAESAGVGWECVPGNSSVPLLCLQLKDNQNCLIPHQSRVKTG